MSTSKKYRFFCLVVVKLCIPYKVNFLWFVSSEAERCTSKEIFYGCLELKHYRKRSAKDLLIEYHAVFLKYDSEEAESRIDCNVHENKFDESDPEE